MGNKVPKMSIRYIDPVKVMEKIAASDKATKLFSQLVSLKISGQDIKVKLEQLTDAEKKELMEALDIPDNILERLFTLSNNTTQLIIEAAFPGEYSKTVTDLIELFHSGEGTKIAARAIYDVVGEKIAKKITEEIEEKAKHVGDGEALGRALTYGLSPEPVGTPQSSISAQDANRLFCFMMESMNAFEKQGLRDSASKLLGTIINCAITDERQELAKYLLESICQIGTYADVAKQALFAAIQAFDEDQLYHTLYKIMEKGEDNETALDYLKRKLGINPAGMIEIFKSATAQEQYDIMKYLLEGADTGTKKTVSDQVDGYLTRYCDMVGSVYTNGDVTTPYYTFSSILQVKQSKQNSTNVYTLSYQTSTVPEDPVSRKLTKISIKVSYQNGDAFSGKITNLNFTEPLLLQDGSDYKRIHLLKSGSVTYSSNKKEIEVTFVPGTGENINDFPLCIIGRTVLFY